MPAPLQQALLLLAAFALVLFTGFFVAAEFALVTVRATRIDALAKDKVFGAALARRALGELNSYLSACQLGVTITTLVLGNFGEHVISSIIGGAFAALPAVYRQTAITLAALALVTLIEVVVGEIAPKTLAIQRAEKIILAVIYPLHIFRQLFQWPIRATNSLAGLVLRPFGVHVDAGHGHEAAHSEDELRLILAKSHAGGEIRETELTLAKRVLDFGHRQAKEVMVPRPDVTFLDAARPLQENLDRVNAAGFSRFPLVDDSPDQILGIIHTKDLLGLMLRPDTNRDSDSLRALARQRPILSVPETKPVDQLLQEFQQRRQRMAVVVDEYGGTAGIVTIEDLVEEIVGDIQDEFDRTASELVPDGEDCYQVDARMALDKLTRQLDFDGPEDPGVDTIGGWVLAHGGTPIRVGANVSYGAARFTITEMAGRRVRKVRVCLPKLQTDPDNDAE